MPTLKNIIVLGRACPEPLKDGRVTVCLAGWSETEGFIRLYPTRYDTPCHQWDIIQVDAERNERDTRAERWKIAGSKGEWENLASKVTVVGRMDSPESRRNLLGNLTDTCVNVINDAKRSLGIVKPDILRTYFRENSKYGELFQMGLPGMTDLGSVQVKRDFPFEPRLVYRCNQCLTESQQHDQQILEWGFYEWFRKNPDKKEQVWDNARIYHSETDIYLLVGNQAAHRTSFMVISVMRVPKGDVVRSMFPYKKWQNE